MTSISGILISGKKITTLSGHNSSVIFCTFSPDGRFIVSVSSGDEITKSVFWVLKIWEASTGKEIATFPGKTIATAFEVSKCGKKITIGDAVGRLYFLKLEGFTLGPAIVTAVRLWSYGKNGGPGSLSTTSTTDCPYCGDRFKVPEQILNSISSNMYEKNFSDPALIYNCPKCAKTLRFNPFLVHTPQNPSHRQTLMKFLQEKGISLTEASTTYSAHLRNHLLRRLFWCKRIIPNILMPFLRRLSYVIKNWNSM